MFEQLSYIIVEGKLTNAFTVVQKKSHRVVYISLGRDEDKLLEQASADFVKLSAKTSVKYVLSAGEEADQEMRTIITHVQELLDNSASLGLKYEYIFGTDFQKRVWRELEKVPSGKTVTYTTIANNLGSPKATRAVGNAVGQNKLALIVPCHRCLPVDGSIGGFRWGSFLKRKLVSQERRRIPGQSLMVDF